MGGVFIDPWGVEPPTTDFKLFKGGVFTKTFKKEPRRASKVNDLRRAPPLARQGLCIFL